MILLFDIGNTHTHVGFANRNQVTRQVDIPTADWFSGEAQASLKKLVGRSTVDGAALCSVVPQATSPVKKAVKDYWQLRTLEVVPATVKEVGIDYPKPESIGPDRLANAVAVKHYYGAPALVVDFGTAVTFDVVSQSGNYVGGIIAPGLAAMTDYLHEKTALLPRIRIREVNAVLGKNTEQAMLIGAVHGYRGLIQGLIKELRSELKVRKLPVVATGGYARLIARKLPEITAVEPKLTLEGVRLTWVQNTGVKI